LRKAVEHAEAQNILRSIGRRFAGFSTLGIAPDALPTQAPSINICARRCLSGVAGRVCSITAMDCLLCSTPYCLLWSQGYSGSLEKGPDGKAVQLRRRGNAQDLAGDLLSARKKVCHQNKAESDRRAN